MANATRQVVVRGFALVSVANEELGTTRDGVMFTSDGFFIDVKNDENGGDAGPPIEVQYLGEIHKIRCELTKFPPAVAKKWQDHCASTTPGVPRPAGTLMFAPDGENNQLGGGATAITITCTNGNNIITRTYGRCIIRDAVELNAGTKFSTFVLTFEAHKDASGRVWNE
jgi:hypothetical protein